MKICESCGKQNQDRAKFCTGCGKVLTGTGATPKPAVAPSNEAGQPSTDSNRAMTPAPKPTPIKAPNPRAQSANSNLATSTAPTMFAEDAVAPATPRPAAEGVIPQSYDDDFDANAPTMFNAKNQNPEANSPDQGPVLQSPSGGLRVAPVVRPTNIMPKNNPAAETMPVTDAPQEPASISGGFSSPMSAQQSAQDIPVQHTPPPNPAVSNMSTLPADEEEPEPQTLAADHPIVVPRGDMPPADPAQSGGQIPAQFQNAPYPCPRCTTEIPAGFIFCGRCGFDIRTYVPPQTDPVPPQEPTPVPQSGPVPDLLLLTPDGQEQARYSLAYGEVLIGRGEGATISCPDNMFLSEKHSLFVWDGQKLLLRDLDSMNGTFVKIRDPAPLRSGDYVCIGQQFLRFEICEIIPSPSQAPDGTYRHGSPLPDVGARLMLIGMGGLEFDTYYLRNEETMIGRVSGDIIFAGDNFISRTHAKITAQNGEFFVTDLESSNGTFLQIQEEATLRDGDLLLMGEQLFQIELPK